MLYVPPVTENLQMTLSPKMVYTGNSVYQPIPSLFFPSPTERSLTMYVERLTSDSGSSLMETWTPSGWRTSTRCWTTTSCSHCPMASVCPSHPMSGSCLRCVCVHTGLTVMSRANHQKQNVIRLNG